MSEELKAGRELDAIIAERVMGWEWWRSSITGERCLFEAGSVPRFPDEWFTKRADGTEPLVFGWLSTDIPAYSTDIAAALSVLESVACDFHIEKTRHVEADGYRVTILLLPTEYSSVHKSFEVDADTLPLAICRAALKAAAFATQGRA